VDVSDGTLISQLDDHGFFGDGTSFAQISFSDTDCLNEIRESAVWKPLPLTDMLRALVMSRTEENGIDTYSPMISDENGQSYFPAVTNGYYFFVDRQSEGSDTEDESEILNRYSFNFTIAIYDADTNMLYYLEIDT
jgi:hypothetical protein